MHVAAYFGNVNLLVALIKHYPVHIDAINRYGWTPLMQAAREGHYNVVEALLATGADPSICNLLGVNALGVATRGGHDKIVDLLLDHDAHVTKGSARFTACLNITIDLHFLFYWTLNHIR